MQSPAVDIYFNSVCCCRRVCCGPIVWTASTGLTPPSSWWESVRLPISYTHWEWSTSPSYSLIPIVWGKAPLLILCSSISWKFKWVHATDFAYPILLLFVFYVLCLLQVVWGAVRGPRWHSVSAVRRLPAGPQGEDLPEDRSLDAALQRHHADSVTLL